MDQVEEYVMQP